MRSYVGKGNQLISAITGNIEEKLSDLNCMFSNISKISLSKSSQEISNRTLRKKQSKA